MPQLHQGGVCRLLRLIGHRRKTCGQRGGNDPALLLQPELELIVDPSLLENDELYFNAARLDRLMVLKTTDYVALANPRLERIVVSR